MLDNPLCLCGHHQGLHIINCHWEYTEFKDPNIHDPFSMKSYMFCKCDGFKLDNLSYIEELAEERNLI